jgi:hypothetical protein
MKVSRTGRVENGERMEASERFRSWGSKTRTPAKATRRGKRSLKWRRVFLKLTTCLGSMRETSPAVFRKWAAINCSETLSAPETVAADARA